MCVEPGQCLAQTFPANSRGYMAPWANGQVGHLLPLFQGNIIGEQSVQKNVMPPPDQVNGGSDLFESRTMIGRVPEWVILLRMVQYSPVGTWQGPPQCDDIGLANWEMK